MLLLAHRGFHVQVPENTMAAFAAAIKVGADGIETDVRLSFDGELVLLHDRLTPHGHPVTALTHIELEREFGYAVPVLAEALDAFPNLYWNIEIKTPDAAHAARAVIEDYSCSRRLLVTSFRHDIIARCAASDAVEWGLLFGHVPVDPQRTLAAYGAGAAFKNAIWDYAVIDAVVLRHFADAGWRNYAYGVERLAEWDHCATLGIVGVIADDPRLARRITAGLCT